MTELHQFLSSSFHIAEQDIAQVANFFQIERLKKGDYFVRRSQYCNRLSFVQDGFIRIYTNKGDKEVTQWISTKGYFVTDLQSFMFGSKARWHIQALTDVTLFSIQKNDYKQLENILPSWPEKERQFISGCFVILEDRVFSHLSLSAEERYEKLFEQNKELFSYVPAQYLASMLGITPETFSRIRRKRLS